MNTSEENFIITTADAEAALTELELATLEAIDQKIDKYRIKSGRNVLSGVFVEYDNIHYTQVEDILNTQIEEEEEPKRYMLGEGTRMATASEVKAMAKEDFKTLVEAFGERDNTNWHCHRCNKDTVVPTKCDIPEIVGGKPCPMSPITREGEDHGDFVEVSKSVYEHLKDRIPAEDELEEYIEEAGLQDNPETVEMVKNIERFGSLEKALIYNAMVIEMFIDSGILKSTKYNISFKYNNVWVKAMVKSVVDYNNIIVEYVCPQTGNLVQSPLFLDEA